MSHAFAGVVPRVLVASASVRAPRERPHAALRRRLRGAAPARAFFGKDDAYPATLRPPMPLPEAVAVGLSCAVSGAKTALASPSDAWKPLTGAATAPVRGCLLYTSPSPRDATLSRMPSSA